MLLLSANADTDFQPTPGGERHADTVRFRPGGCCAGPSAHAGADPVGTGCQHGRSTALGHAFEAGKPTVALILVLRILETLDLTLDVTDPTAAQKPPSSGSTDLDNLLGEYAGS